MVDTASPARDDGGLWPPPGIHQGRSACRAMLLRALTGLAPSAGAPWAGARVLWLVDPDFTDWPLDEPAVHDALVGWLRQGDRQLRIVGQRFDEAQRQHPRFARWRRDWTHAVGAWAPSEGALPSSLRGLLAAPLRVEWLDAPDWRLRCTSDVAHGRLVHGALADFLQRCEPAWPATTLGL